VVLLLDDMVKVVVMVGWVWWWWWGVEGEGPDDDGLDDAEGVESAGGRERAQAGKLEIALKPPAPSSGW